jgi:diguanylate cyclase (GGDEF)-like protein
MHLLTFIVATYLEVLVHMTLAVYFTGWENGFQITLFGMNIMIFFAEYLGRSIEGRYVPALPFSILGMFMYIGAYIVSQKHTAAYSLPPELSFWLEIAWGAVVFIINIVCLQGFVYLTFNSEAILSEKATRDRLTGLPNRYYMSTYLSDLEKERRLESSWIAMMDIDDFKLINDKYGHNFGDYVLQTIANIMNKYCVETQFCRWGGEEFLVVGEIGEGMDEQYKRLDTFRSRVEEHLFKYDGLSINLTMTIGAVAYEKGQTIDEWINMADKKMYLGKQNGKNQVVI